MGVKEGYKGPIDTVLLTDIKNKNCEIVTDHLWFNFTKGFQNAKMETGDEIKFDARVKSYEKGYKGYRDDVYKPIETDYKLNYPSRIKNLSRKGDENE